jgi:hypothetical protein
MTLLDPAFQLAEVVHGVGTSSSDAVAHTWHHKHLRKLLGLLASTHHGAHSIVIAEQPLYRHGSVVRSEVHDYLATCLAEALQVGIRGVYTSS